MDKTYPDLVLGAPENNSTQNSKQTQVSISATDEHFDRIGYSLNNADTTWFSTPDTSFYVNSQEGYNELLVIAEDKAGNQTLEKRIYTVDSTFVNIEDDSTLPKNYSLSQNYPNPFNSTTTIKYILPKDGNVALRVYDIEGKQLETLVNKNQVAGEHNIKWDSSKYPAGIHLYQLKTKDFTKTKKMTSLK